MKFRSGEVDGLRQREAGELSLVRGHTSRTGNYTLHDLGPALAHELLLVQPEQGPKGGGGQEGRRAARRPDQVRLVQQPGLPARGVDGHRSRRDDSRASSSATRSRTGRRRRQATSSGTRPTSSSSTTTSSEAKKLLASLELDGQKRRRLSGRHAPATPIGFTLKTNSDNKLRVSMANFIRDDLAKVGIKVTLVAGRLQHAHHQPSRRLPVRGDPAGPADGRAARIRRWARTSGARAAARTTGTSSQPKPETPEEARIDALMDVLISTPGPREAEDGLEGNPEHRQRAVLADLAADA